MQAARNVCFQNDCSSKEKEGSQNFLVAVSNDQQMCQDNRSEKQAMNESCTKFMDMCQPMVAASSNQCNSAPMAATSSNQCATAPMAPIGYGKACGNSYVPMYGTANNRAGRSCGNSYVPVYGNANLYAGRPSSCNESQEMSNNECVNEEPCCRTSNNLWINRKLVDQDGSCVVVPNRLTYDDMRRKYWCCTPLTEYQATTGELARKILVGETVIKRRIDSGPPCNITEDILIPCRGYLRDECFIDRPPCVDGKLDTRPVVKRYWKPCINKLACEVDSSAYAGTGVALARKVRKCVFDNACY